MFTDIITYDKQSFLVIKNLKKCTGENSEKILFLFKLNPFMHNVVKWPNILQKSCGVNTARFLKYVWPIYNIMHERVKKIFFDHKPTD